MDYQKQPLKLYIQDIFRAKQTEDNKYLYEIFGLRFKNLMINGVVTSIYNKTDSSINLELSDPTGCVQIYYNNTKHNMNISKDTMKDLIKSFAKTSRSGNGDIVTMSSLLNSIEKKHNNPIDFEEGSHVNVIGDIFLDSFTDTRMISAYQCKTISIERDIIWMEELRYLYDKYYINPSNCNSKTTNT